MAERDYPGGNPFYDYGPWGVAAAAANTRVYRPDGAIDYARSFERFAQSMKWLGLAGSTLKTLYNAYEAAQSNMYPGTEIDGKPVHATGYKRIRDEEDDNAEAGPSSKRPRLGPGPEALPPKEVIDKPNIKFLDTELTNSMISTAYTWPGTFFNCTPASAATQSYWLTNVAQGVGYNKRTGDQIFIKDVWVKANFSAYTSPTGVFPDIQVALIHCAWIDPNVAAVPNPTWYQLWPAGIGGLTAVTPAANYKATVVRKWRFSEDPIYKMQNSNTYNWAIDETVPIRKEAVYKGTDNIKGALYLIILSNINPPWGSGATGGFAVRVYFVDRRQHDTQRSWEKKKKVAK